MPYSNMPKSKWKKMERCVSDLKSQGKSGDSPYAICHSSIMGTIKKNLKKNKSK